MYMSILLSILYFFGLLASGGSTILPGGRSGEFTVGVRDSLMVAHSFQGPEFGAAQNMHGATFTVDVELSSPELVEKCNWVYDMTKVSDIVKEILEKYHMKNLNELFPNENTTTEFMCREIHTAMCDKLKQKHEFKGGLRVKL